MAYAFEKRLSCGEPGCERPALVGDELGDCAAHRAAYDAKAEEEAWGFAGNVLRPWVEAARAIGHPELTRVMEGALAEGEEAVNRALDKLERAEEGADV